MKRRTRELLRISNKQIMALLYIFSMTIAFTTIYGDISLDYHLQISIGMLWLVIAFLKFTINGFRFHGKFAKDFPKFIKLYMLPHLVIHGYTIILMFLGKVSWDYFTTNLTVYVPTLLAIMAIYLIGEKVYQYTCIALALSWLLSVGTSLLVKGPRIFTYAIIQGYFDANTSVGGLTKNYLELHDLVLGIGYVVIFYLFINSKLTKKQLALLTIVFVIMLLGMKRIAVLGIILAVLFCIVLKRFSENKQYKICLIAGWMVFVFCYLFIYALADGGFFYDLVSIYGINTMGRTYYYQAIMSYAEFTPKFIGIGRNAVTRILTSELAYLRVAGVHSDVIKMYVENGFILFGLWLWYYLIHITKFYRREYGIKNAVLYFGIVTYMFTLYLTDNVEIYFICQILSTMIPVYYAMYGKDKSVRQTL